MSQVKCVESIGLRPMRHKLNALRNMAVNWPAVVVLLLVVFCQFSLRQYFPSAWPNRQKVRSLH